MFLWSKLYRKFDYLQMNYVFPFLAVFDDMLCDELEMSSRVNMGRESYVTSLQLPLQFKRKIQALNLLVSLLTGKHGDKVQETLAKLRIGPLLSELFEKLFCK